MRFKKHWNIALAGLMAVGLGGCGSEHPEEQTKNSTSGGVSTAELAKAIENHVSKAAGGGAFKFTRSEPRIESAGEHAERHSRSRIELSLTLDKIHKDRLQQTAPNTYFACADFKGSDGKMYDLDFWVTGTAGKLKVTQTMLHKEEGKERYTWSLDKNTGVWKQDFSVKAGTEHPKGEHPKKKSSEKEHPK